VSENPSTAASSSPSLLQPFQVGIFRAIWTASLFSNFGNLMHQVASAWLMTSMTESPVVVALLQTAATLPVFLVGLPAGVLADLLPRRTLLLVTQSWLLLVAATIALVTYLDMVTPGILLTLTFCLGLGTAINLPAWQATVPYLVPREMLGSAVSLNSIGFNAARSIGPAIGGLLVAAAGPAFVFLINALTYIGVIVIFASWHPAKRKRRATEDALGALRAGWRYVRHSPHLHAPLVRVGAFMFSAAVVLSLLPLVAREVWTLDSDGYGLLLAAFGVGSIVGAVLIPTLRRWLSVDWITGGAILIATSSMILLGTTEKSSWAGLGMFSWGVAWTTSLVNLNVAMQLAIAGWVRGRCLAYYQLVMMGSMAAGSAFWGWVAAVTQLQQTFVIAGVAMAGGLLLIPRFRLAANDNLDLRPNPDLVEHEHHVTTPLDQENGPVLVKIEYRICKEDEAQFRGVMQRLRTLRKRDGAAVWRLYRDTSDPEIFIELFRADTWAEHLRIHERRMMGDQEIYEEVHSLHRGDHPPQVAHFSNVMN